MEQESSRRRLAIVDRPLLAQVARWIRDTGMLNDPNCPIPPSVLSKLISQRQSAIAVSTMDHLMNYLDRAESEAGRQGREDMQEAARDYAAGLLAAILSPAARELVWGDYQKWITERLERFVSRRGPSVAAPVPSDDHPAPSVRRVRRRDDASRSVVWPRLHLQYFGAPARRLQALLDCRARMREVAPEPLAQFEARAQRLGHDPYRVEVALVRIAEPLVECEESGGMERHFRDLSDDELRRYVTAALRAESILLDRPSVLHKAQALAPAGAKLGNR